MENDKQIEKQETIQKVLDYLGDKGYIDVSIKYTLFDELVKEL